MSTIASRVCPSATALPGRSTPLPSGPRWRRRADRALGPREVGKLGPRGSHGCRRCRTSQAAPRGVGSTCVLALPHGTRATSGPTADGRGHRPRTARRRDDRVPKGTAEPTEGLDRCGECRVTMVFTCLSRFRRECPLGQPPLLRRPRHEDRGLRARLRGLRVGGLARWRPGTRSSGSTSNPVKVELVPRGQRRRCSSRTLGELVEPRSWRSGASAFDDRRGRGGGATELSLICVGTPSLRGNGSLVDRGTSSGWPRRSAKR